MFWRRKPGDSSANRLSDEARPNELRFDVGEENEFADDQADELDEENGEAGEDLEDDVADATYEDEPIDEDEEVAAERAAALQEEIQRQAEEFGLTTVDATIAYGPNGDEVLSFEDRLLEVPDEEIEDRLERWESVPKNEKQVAAMVARDIAEDAGLSREVDAALHFVSTWVSEAIRLSEDETGSAERFYRAAQPMIADAITALVLKEDLQDVDYETLGGAWAEEVAARPALEPEPEEESEAAVATGEGDFGPNGDLVAELLARLESLSEDEALALAEAWKGQPRRALQAAHRDLQMLAKEDVDWRDQVRRAQDRVRSWASLKSVRPSPSARSGAAPAIADAAAALVLADLLERQNAELLYAPWQETIGAPELALDDEEETE